MSMHHVLPGELVSDRGYDFCRACYADAAPFGEPPMTSGTGHLADIRVERAEAHMSKKARIEV